MERFITVRTPNSQSEADLVITILEDIQIPVILSYDDGHLAQGRNFRVMVPERFLGRALHATRQYESEVTVFAAPR